MSPMAMEPPACDLAGGRFAMFRTKPEHPRSVKGLAGLHFVRRNSPLV